jgi:hypothetical protein
MKHFPFHINLTQGEDYLNFHKSTSITEDAFLWSVLTSGHKFLGLIQAAVLLFCSADLEFMFRCLQRLHLAFSFSINLCTKYAHCAL